MNLPIKTLITRTMLSIIVFCMTFAVVLGGWVYVQSYNDQKLLREFSSQKLGLDIARAEQFMAICGDHTSTGTCSALRYISGKKKCAQITSKLRNASSDCSRTFVDFKGQVIQVQLTGYSEKVNLYMEITLMQQHPLLNIIG